jgi:hypothetical protein
MGDHTLDQNSWYGGMAVLKNGGMAVLAELAEMTPSLHFGLLKNDSL